MLLVDWFRAERYDKELNYVVSLASNNSKKRAPELLLGFTRYDPSKVDMWGVGLAIADVVGILLRVLTCSYLPEKLPMVETCMT